ncbi:MAG: hypothetical protein HY804_13580 [Nitrospinae bacterium]|nr:hypothetical protein [Nitrospinota bacterium]
MKVAQPVGVRHEYLKELADITGKFERYASKRTFETVDTKKILEYTASVEVIHQRLRDAYNASEGRSRALDRFINRWNNLVLGVFYIRGAVEENKTITERQYEIFTKTIKDILEYATVGKAADQD